VARTRSWLARLLLTGLLLGSAGLAAQDEPEPTADARLAQARKAAEENDYAAAAKHYREFLARFATHAEVDNVRLALAVVLLEKPNTDYRAALDQLQILSGKKNTDRQAAMLFYEAVATRGQALAEMGKPGTSRGGAATKQVEAAAAKFAAAADALTSRLKAAPKNAAEPPIEVERAACARCAQMESLLRAGKSRDAQPIATAFLKDDRFRASRYRDTALYFHGLACYRSGKSFAAGRSLNLIGSFAGSEFTSHARYLLARIHEQAEERAEAVGHYQAILADYEAQKNQANEILKQPDKVQNNPAKLAQLEAFLKAPPPDMILCAGFRLGLLHYEAGRFADAQERFAELTEQPPTAPYRNEAQLLRGICAVRLEQYADAVKILQPIVEQQPALAPAALFWLGKARTEAADPENVERFQADLSQAETILRRALDKYQAAGDRTRRGGIMLAIADIHHRAGRFKEAAAVLDFVLKDALLPHRAEEVRQRRATDLNLAGIYGEAHRACIGFQQAHPLSAFSPEVLFRRAESAYFLAVNAEPNARIPGAGQPAAQQELARWQDEASRHYQLVIDKYPEAPQANYARLSLGLLHYRKGALDKTVEVLEQIPAPDRGGELSAVPFLEADGLIRLAPTQGDDALSAGRMREQLGRAVELLSGLVAEHPDHPQAVDALLRVAICQQRLAVLEGKPEDRKNVLAAARASAERVLIEYPLSELASLAVLERARCLAQTADDPSEAMARLRSFAAEPLRKQPVAPLALLQVATLLRGRENGAGEAAQVLARCRQQHEKTLLQDPGRANWGPLLKYHHGVALKEVGRFAEARALFDTLLKEHASSPLAKEVILRRGQTVNAEARDAIGKAQQVLGTQDIKPNAAAEANRNIEEAWKMLTANLRYWETQAAQLQKTDPTSEARARLLYELAWAERAFIDREVEATRARLQAEEHKRLQDQAAKNTPEGQPVPQVPPLDVPLAKIPLQRAEKQARLAYQQLIAAFPDADLTHSARLELGELHMDRGETQAAQQAFAQALDKEPPPDLTSRLRLRLGTLLASQGNHKAALPHFEAVARNPENPWAGQGMYRAAECLARLGDLNGAVQRLTAFRDNEKFHNVGGVSDLALLRLGQMLVQLKRWDESRQTLEQLFARFGGSGWVREGVYATGWAWHKEKQYDNAVARYQQAVADQGDETAARALVMIGVSQLEREQYPEAAASFQAIADKFGSSEWSALALLEAAHAQTRLKQPAEAKKLLERVSNDFAGSGWANIAKGRLKKPDQSPPHGLPAALALLTPALTTPPALDTLGQYVDDRVSLADPARDIIWTLIMARTPGQRQRPFAWQRQSLPDPFENHRPISIPAAAMEEEVRGANVFRLP
jgi:TolA-binding protein